MTNKDKAVIREALMNALNQTYDDGENELNGVYANALAILDKEEAPSEDVRKFVDDLESDCIETCYYEYEGFDSGEAMKRISARDARRDEELVERIIDSRRPCSPIWEAEIREAARRKEWLKR